MREEEEERRILAQVLADLEVEERVLLELLVMVRAALQIQEEEVVVLAEVVVQEVQVALVLS
ncbi:MAG: hypothetical protein BWY29_00863 [Microgenomates group bacterium ADurb.Bin238]|nr:MAG: hypothetical protein BWY29_00863 [Microgenomates group bacterium ADurb.Bin238]